MVLLVAPRTSYPFDPSEIPPEVPELTWEDTAARIETFEVAEPVGRFLVDELLAYLTEERLVDPGPLTATYLDSLASYYDAKRSLVRACEIGSESVTELPRTEDGSGSYPRGSDPTNYWWDYTLTTPDGRTVHVPDGWSGQWQLVLNARAALVDGPIGAPLLMAGLVSGPGGLTSFTSETLEDLVDAGLDVLPAGVRAYGWDYIARTATPAALELARMKDLTSQGQRIAEWVDGSFRVIAEVLRRAPEQSTAG